MSNWLRDYLYISLGGNRGGAFATYRNQFLTMLLGGLWHGANWTFIVWGAWHGCLLAIEKWLGVDPKRTTFSPFGWLLTLFLVMLGWVVFRADSVTTAFSLYQSMFFFDGFGLTGKVAEEATGFRTSVLVLAWLIALSRGWFVKFAADFRFPEWTYRAVLPVFFLALLKLSADSHSPFLYFQF